MAGSSSKSPGLSLASPTGSIGKNLNKMSMKLSPGKRSMVIKRKMLASGLGAKTGKDTKAFAEIEEHEEFDEAQKRTCKDKYCSATCWKKVWGYMRESSCFVIHKKWRIR